MSVSNSIVTVYGENSGVFIESGFIGLQDPSVTEKASEVLRGLNQITGRMLQPDSLHLINSNFVKVHSDVLTPENKQMISTHKFAVKVLLKKYNCLSNNQIFKMRFPKEAGFEISGKAFLKFGACDSIGMAVMEKLMWKVSKIMGFENLFVPTKMVELFLKGNDVPLIGSMQPAATGRLLHTWLEKEDFHLPQVKDSAMNFAILASIVLGMFDAHSFNIMIDEQGEIKFFDNTLSMPNSNGLIGWGDMYDLTTSYRCGLLNLSKRVAKLLTPQETKDLLVKAKCCLENFSTLQEYLLHGKGKGLMAKLPKYWLDTGPMLEAMRERIQSAIECLSAQKTVNLVELAVKANPDYLLGFAISFLNGLAKAKTPLTRKEMIDEADKQHDLLNMVRLKECLRNLRNRQYDMSHVLQIYRDSPDYPLLVERLVDYHMELSKVKPASLPIESDLAALTLFNHIVLDLKGHDRKFSGVWSNVKENHKQLQKMGVPLITGNEERIWDYVGENENFILTDPLIDSIYFVYWSEIGMLHRRATLRKPGKIFVSFKSRWVGIPIEHASKFITHEPGSLCIGSFPIYSDNLDPKSLFKRGNRLQVLRMNEGVVIYTKGDDGKIRKHIYPSTEDQEGFFNKNGVKISLEDTVIESQLFR